MAAFIHHFTRFRAHGESVRMEARMKAETVLRIAGCLHGTMKAIITELHPYIRTYI